MFNFFNTLSHGILGLFFLVMGGIGILIPWAPALQRELVYFFQENHAVVFVLGAGFALIGLGILLGQYYRLKKRVFHLKRGSFSIDLNEKVFRQCLDKYWKNRYPRIAIAHQLQMKRGKVVMHAELPDVPEAQRQSVLKSIQDDLEDLFIRVLGYQGTLQFNAQFKVAEEP